MNWRMQLINELMELIFIYSGSSMGLSDNQNTRLKELYNGLTESGKEYIQIWAEDNSFKMPSF